MHKQLVLEQLYSKKNLVYHIRVGEQDIVSKKFTDADRFCIETEIGDLLQNSDLLTPRRLSIDPQNLTINYAFIKGTPVVDLIETGELWEAQNIIGQICAWLESFYNLTLRAKGEQLILGDIHLRNFLYEETSQSIYGIDFEDCRTGRIETDIARLYTFILHYDPAFTPRKKALAAYLWTAMSAALPLDKPFFLQEVRRETDDLLTRRKPQLDPSIKNGAG